MTPIDMVHLDHGRPGSEPGDCMRACIASLSTGRRFIGAELSDEYFGRALARLEATSFVDQAQLFEGLV